MHILTTKPGHQVQFLHYLLLHCSAVFGSGFVNRYRWDSGLSPSLFLCLFTHPHHYNKIWPPGTIPSLPTITLFSSFRFWILELVPQRFWVVPLLVDLILYTCASLEQNLATRYNSFLTYSYTVQQSSVLDSWIGTAEIPGCPPPCFFHFFTCTSL